MEQGRWQWDAFDHREEVLATRPSVAADVPEVRSSVAAHHGMLQLGIQRRPSSKRVALFVTLAALLRPEIRRPSSCKGTRPARVPIPRSSGLLARGCPSARSHAAAGGAHHEPPSDGRDPVHTSRQRRGRVLAAGNPKDAVPRHASARQTLRMPGRWAAARPPLV